MSDNDLSTGPTTARRLSALSVSQIHDQATAAASEDDNPAERELAARGNGFMGTVCFGLGMIGRGWTHMGLTIQTLLGVALGFGVALIIRATEGNLDPDGTALKLLAYPGVLFVSALKLIVVPMIFFGMVLSVIKLGDISKIKFIGGRALCYYLTTTFIAAIEGLIWVNIFQPGAGGSDEASEPDRVDMFLKKLNATNKDIFNAFEQSEVIKDFAPGHFPASKETVDAFLDVGVSMLPPNIVEAFINTNILGIIVFSLLLGFYINRTEDAEGKRIILAMFDTVNSALMGIVNMLIAWTPLGIFSLVVKEIVLQDKLVQMLTNLGMFIVTVMIGLLGHLLIVYPGIYFFMTRKSPLPVFKAIVQVILTAFATSSSAATLPVTIKSVESLGVHKDISRFILPLGATINMDGTAIYFPIAVIFLANLIDQAPSFGGQIAIAFVASFVSIGAAPIPNAGLVYLILILSSVGIPVPNAISTVLAVDWFLDRLQTACNVTGDSFGAALLHHLREAAGMGPDIESDKQVEMAVSE